MLIAGLLASGIAVAQSTGGNGSITVENNTGYDVEVIDHDPDKDTYKVHRRLPPGETLSEEVAPQTEWFFRVNDDQYIGQYKTTDESGQSVVLDESTLDGVGYPHRKGSNAAPEADDEVTAAPPPLPDALPQDPPQGVAEAAALSGSQTSTDSGAAVPLRNWYEGPDAAVALTAMDGAIVNLSTDNQLTIVKSTYEKPAQTTATWLLESIPGTERSRIRNVYFADRFLYIDQGARDGSTPRIGAEGKTLPSGEWIIKPGAVPGTNDVINAARPDLRLAIRDSRVLLSTASYDHADLALAMQAFRKGDAWMLNDVKSFRALMAMKDTLAKDLVTADKNVKAMDEAVATEKADSEQRKKDAADRRREPEIIEAGTNEEQVSMRLGVGEVFTTDKGAQTISYKYDEDGAGVLKSDLGTSDNEDSQHVVLELVPEISAFVVDKKLYVRLHTPVATSMLMRHGSRPSSDFPTDGNFFVGEVKINVFFPWGREVYRYPATQMERTEVGKNSEKSIGFQGGFDPRMWMANFSESHGTNVSFSESDYSFDSHRGAAKSETEGSMQYQWKACGLAGTSSETSNCTYSAPTDLWESFRFKDIKPIALELNGLESDTIFRVNSPEFPQLPDRLQVYVQVQAQVHAVFDVFRMAAGSKQMSCTDIPPMRKGDNSPQNFPWVGAYRCLLPQLPAGTNGRKGVGRIGFYTDKLFNYFLYLPIEDLKPFMK